MTAVHDSSTLVERLTSEFDVLPVALVRRCVDAAIPTASTRQVRWDDVEGTARRDLVGLADALQRRETATGR